MGDSFTAAPFVPLNDVASGCNRSSNNYPHLVARALHIDDLEDRSCTGAQTVDLYGRRQLTAYGRSVPPQFTALSADTDLVTVGIGANNGRLYARMATVCRKMATICPLYDERDSLRAIVDQLGPELVSTLDQVRERAPSARVLLVGYPKLLPQRGNCSRLPRMRPQDRATFRAMNLGHALRDARRRQGGRGGVRGLLPRLDRARRVRAAPMGAGSGRATATAAPPCTRCPPARQRWPGWWSTPWRPSRRRPARTASPGRPCPGPWH